MTDPLNQQLLGHLLGALDDDEHQRVDARLERDEECCRELIQWRRRLTPLETMRPDFEPPPGLAERACRYVGACVAVSAYWQPWGPRRKMSPCPAPPSRVAGVGWLDVAVVTLLLLTTAALILPAIDGSRFHTRLASCQEALRQFGLALTQYSHHQQSALWRLASNGKLTDAGVFAAGLLEDGYLTDSRRPVCPDAWLAAQGVLHASSHGDQPNDWPGTWRDGTTNGWRPPPSPADVPLLADAPSADLPGQGFESHGGRGRNVLFEDGRVRFLPCAAPRDLSDWRLSTDEDSAAGAISAPIVFVGGR